MPRQSVITQKKKRRGPPPTGKGNLIGVRLQPPLLAAVDAWIFHSGKSISRPEAIRRLVEAALAGSAGPNQHRKRGSKRKAAQLAEEALDRLGDQGVLRDELARRKRRLIKGPAEFRELRGDQPNKKG
jgi:hypothetical protein